MSVQIQQSSFGTTSSGQSVELYTFTNSAGVSLSVTNYGCTITSLNTPDKAGELADIVLGYDTLAQYEKCERFLGCVVGRYANRIKHGRFSLNGVSYQLETNPSGHHLHGGPAGFNKQVWQASVIENNGLPLLVLKHLSPDGHAGYPGNLECSVAYSLSEAGEITIEYSAATDRPTVVNVTNHSYFNLAGHQQAVKNAVLDHQVMLNCDSFLPTDDTGIPVSDPVTVVGSPMDFRSATAVGARIHGQDTQLQNAKGYDHSWVINRNNNDLALAARVTEPVSGRLLEIKTTQPGIQLYTGNYINSLQGKSGAHYEYRGALCLETQHFPDSPNNDSFPSTVVVPGIPMHQVTVYRVGITN